MLVCCIKQRNTPLYVRVEWIEEEVVVVGAYQGEGEAGGGGEDGLGDDGGGGRWGQAGVGNGAGGHVEGDVGGGHHSCTGGFLQQLPKIHQKAKSFSLTALSISSHHWISSTDKQRHISIHQ